MQKLWADWSPRLLEGTLRVAFQILIVLILLWLARWIGLRIIATTISPPWARERLTEAQKARLRTIQTILSSVLHYVLLFVGALTVLGILGINLAPVLATAGVTGLAIGFGAQRLVRDVISGFFILLEDQFAVGEYVTIDNTSGIVEAIGMRVTRLRDEEGRFVIIANGDINRVVNHSRSAIRGIVELGIPQTVLPEEARERLSRLCAGFQHDSLQAPPAIVGVSLFDSNRYVFQIEFHAAQDQIKPVQSALREHLLKNAREVDLPIA